MALPYMVGQRSAWTGMRNFAVDVLFLPLLLLRLSPQLEALSLHFLIVVVRG